MREGQGARRADMPHTCDEAAHVGKGAPVQAAALPLGHDGRQARTQRLAAGGARTKFLSLGRAARYASDGPQRHCGLSEYMGGSSRSLRGSLAPPSPLRVSEAMT